MQDNVLEIVIQIYPGGYLISQLSLELPHGSLEPGFPSSQQLAPGGNDVMVLGYHVTGSDFKFLKIKMKLPKMSKAGKCFIF